jgi:hypothetical protein
VLSLRVVSWSWLSERRLHQLEEEHCSRGRDLDLALEWEPIEFCDAFVVTGVLAFVRHTKHKQKIKRSSLWFFTYLRGSQWDPCTMLRGNMMLSASARYSRFATTIMVASFSNAAAFSTATSRVTSILDDPSLITGDSPPSQTFDVFDPGASAAQFEDGTAVIAHVRRMGRDDTKAAIDRAHEVLPDWRDKTTAAHRSGILSKWSSLIKESAEDIAKIMTLESGKPLSESRGEVNYGASFFDYYAAEAIRPNSAGGGFISPSPFAMPDGGPRGKIMAIHEAVGVCGLITPWNFPIAMITRKVGPALAAGCTCILKPSELTPLTAVALKTLATRAGVPDGVFELVTADRELTREVGDEMCTNSIIKKISFTGSTPVGKLLMKQSSDTVKRLSLELGGNAPFIVFDDADVDVAVNAAMSSKVG